jgi:lysozyme
MVQRSLFPPRAVKTTDRALIGSVIVASAMALIQPFEGVRTDPYQDIVGVWTVCAGETHVPMRRYSRAECDAMLKRAIEGDYGLGVLAAVPEIQHRPGPFIASISLAYNIGVPAFTRSTAAQRFRAGDWRGGCDAFLLWDKAGGKTVPGLVRRRRAERAECLKRLD